jgi:inner membrane protein
MLIPGEFIASLVSERQQRQAEVVNEVSSKWAGKQIVTGPLLLIPYKVFETAANGTVVEKQKTAYVLPDELHIAGTMQPHEKKRSLYSVMLYGSGINLSGKFGPLPLAALQIPAESIIWQDIRLVLSVGDMRGIDDQVQLSWNGVKRQFDAGVPPNIAIKEGLSVPVLVNPQNPSEFNIQLSLRGSDYLYFTPVGKTTEADLQAAWKDPAFDGQYLPSTSDITDKGFKAHWKVLPLSHTYPQFWKDAAQDLNNAAFGVRLIQPVDGYAKTYRCVKYALLFIALTFTFFFFLEILQKRQVHPLQYIMVGLALTIFYTLLLSISEYTGFNPAYLISSLATVSLVGLYAWSIFYNGRTAIVFTLALSGLYTYIFVLIQLEDYALLFGSIGLFVIIAIIMFYSRKIDWYGIIRHEPKPVQPHEQQFSFTEPME